MWIRRQERDGVEDEKGALELMSGKLVQRGEKERKAEHHLLAGL